MAQFDITMLGDAQLSQQLANLDAKLQRSLLKDALSEGADALVREAKRRAPKGATGLLEANIHKQPMRAKKGRVGWTVRTGTPAQMGILTREEGYYPAHVELGHRIRRKRARQGAVRRLIAAEFGTRTVPPRPYMRPALLENVPTILEIVRQALAWRVEDELR